MHDCSQTRVSPLDQSQIFVYTCIVQVQFLHVLYFSMQNSDALRHKIAVNGNFLKSGCKVTSYKADCNFDFDSLHENKC